MRHIIQHFLETRFPDIGSKSALVACALAEHICSPQFTALFAQRTTPFPTLGLGPETDLLWSKAMSAQTEAFAAAVSNLKSQLGTSGLSADQVDSHIHAVVDPLTDKISAIANGEADDASKVAEIQTELGEFTAAFTAAPATPAATPAPTQAPAA